MRKTESFVLTTRSLQEISFVKCFQNVETNKTSNPQPLKTLKLRIGQLFNEN